LFIVSKELPILSRPILLLYAFEELANVLSLLTLRPKRETEIATMNSLISKVSQLK
jgi:hypothetical protein